MSFNFNTLILILLYFLFLTVNDAIFLFSSWKDLLKLQQLLSQFFISFLNVHTTHFVVLTAYKQLLKYDFLKNHWKSSNALKFLKLEAKN